MSHSNSLIVLLLRRFFIGTVAGAVGGFVCGMLGSIQLQTALMADLIIGISFGIAEVISIIGKTWWQNSLLWGTTMGIMISLLTRLLLPSIDLNIMSVILSCIIYSLGVNFLEKVVFGI